MRLGRLARRAAVVEPDTPRELLFDQLVESTLHLATEAPERARIVLVTAVFDGNGLADHEAKMGTMRDR
jgi:hypothetical protein